MEIGISYVYREGPFLAPDGCSNGRLGFHFEVRHHQVPIQCRQIDDGTQSLELEWWSLRRFSSLEQWRWLSVPGGFCPGRAIGLGRSDHFRLHTAGTVTRCWLVGLWLVVSWLVWFTTLFLLRSRQSLLRRMDLNAVVHGFLQLLSRWGCLPLQLLRLCLLMSVPFFWQPCFAHYMVSLWCSCVLHWSGTVDIAHGYRLVSESDNRLRRL